MKPSLIVYNVPNGKTRFAERIAKFYGLKDGEDHKRIGMYEKEFIYFVEDGTLPYGILKAGAIIKSFREVADEINAAIKPSQWQNGEPAIIGEYDVKYSEDKPNYRRWWHGDSWSYAMLDGTSQESKNLHAGFRQDPTWRPFWRGLSEEPINTEE